jgi:hypothetical protein
MTLFTFTTDIHRTTPLHIDIEKVDAFIRNVDQTSVVALDDTANEILYCLI